MKIPILSFFLIMLSFQGFSQTNSSSSQTKLKEFIKKTSFEKGIRTIESNCPGNCYNLAQGLVYKLRRTEFAGRPDDIKYEFIITTDPLPFEKTLNETIKVILERGDGGVDEVPTLENAGFFKGTLTVLLKDPLPIQKNGLKHLILYGEKTIFFCINEKESEELKVRLGKLMAQKFLTPKVSTK